MTGVGILNGAALLVGSGRLLTARIGHLAGIGRLLVTIGLLVFTEDLFVHYVVVVVAVAVEAVVDRSWGVPVVPGLVVVDPAAALVVLVVIPVVVPVVPVVPGLDVVHPAVAVVDHHGLPIVGLVPVLFEVGIVVVVVLHVARGIVGEAGVLAVLRVLVLALGRRDIAQSYTGILEAIFLLVGVTLLLLRLLRDTAALFFLFVVLTLESLALLLFFLGLLLLTYGLSLFLLRGRGRGLLLLLGSTGFLLGLLLILGGLPLTLLIAPLAYDGGRLLLLLLPTRSRARGGFYGRGCRLPTGRAGGGWRGGGEGVCF